MAHQLFTKGSAARIFMNNNANKEKSKNRLVDNGNKKETNNINKYNTNKKRGRNAISNLSLGNQPAVVDDINERFIDACENGDYPTVTHILETLKDFNIDVTDNLGRTALRLAVENEHLEVVQALLGKSDSQKMREALLLAIYMGHTQIAESILRHPKYKVLNEKKFVNSDADSFWQTPSSDDAQFSPDITPLILASQYNRTELVQMLLISGDRIIKPHQFDCKCNECSNKFKFDSLRHAQSRLNAYRGLASESYISLASLDPFLTAFELGRELRLLAEKEKYFKAEYIQLANNLSQYAVKLLNNVRGRDELEIVLNKTGKEAEEKFEKLARLDLALKYQEKPFVAHSNCQQKLVEIWYEGIRPVTKMNQLLLLGVIALFIICLPFSVLLYILAPKTKFSKFMCQPFVKFVSHTAMYVTFIVLIIMSSLQFADDERRRERFSTLMKNTNYLSIFQNYTKNTDLLYRFPTNDFFIRSHFPNNLDIAISIWVIGFLWHEAKQIYEDGIKNYLLQWNNIIDSCMIMLYASSFVLKYYTLVFVNFKRKSLEDPNFWTRVMSLSGSDTAAQADIFETFYWLNDDRFYWVSLDPINLAEALFAVANIFSFSRICFLLPANQKLGPLQITLGKMTSDILKFVFIFLIILSGFMFALNNLFWYYQSNTRKNVEIVPHLNSDNSSTKAEKAFGSIGLTFQTVFWSVFGLGNGENVKLEPFDNYLTVSFGYILYGAFHIGSIIILLNMLIAMMTKSYEDIITQTDTEWKFSRSKLYMEFVKGGASLPVPFNIIPTPKSFFYLMRRLYRLITCQKEKKKEPAMSIEEVVPRRSPRNNQHMNGNMENGIKKEARNGNLKKAEVVREEAPSGANSSDLTYTKVIQRIVKRFLLSKQRESDEVNESDFEELKQDLQMIRFEIANHLRTNSDDTLRYMSLIHCGIIILGNEILKNEDKDSEIIQKFNELKAIEIDLQDLSTENESENGDKLKSSSDRNSISLDEGLNSVEKLDNEIKVVKLNSLPNISLGTNNASDDNKEESRKMVTIDNVNFEIIENVDEQKDGRPLSKFGQKRLTRTKTISLVELNAIKEEEEQSGTLSETDLPASNKTTL